MLKKILLFILLILVLSSVTYAFTFKDYEINIIKIDPKTKTFTIEVCKDAVCNTFTEEDAGLYNPPIQCLRDKGFCSAVSKKLYLSKRDCDNTINPLCDVQYLTEVK